MKLLRTKNYASLGINGFRLKRRITAVFRDVKVLGGYYPVFDDALTVPGGTLLMADSRRCSIIGRTWVPVIDPSGRLGWVHREAVQSV